MNNKISNILSNPQLNGLGVIVGLVGIIFAIFTYWDSQTYPELIAQVHPAKAVLVSEQGVQELTVYANEKKVDGPITSVQIAIWNNGKKAIKAEDVLEGIGIKTDQKVEVLSAKVLKQSRKIINLSVSANKANEGILGLSFKIFEKNDSALLQITYVGKDNVDFIGFGSLVGQSHFKVLKYENVLSKKQNDEFELSSTAKRAFVIVGLLGLIYFVFDMVKTILKQASKLREVLNSEETILNKWIEAIILSVGSGLFLILLVMGCTLLYQVFTEIKSPYI